LDAGGARSVQLTHYPVNETGDIQTAPRVHGGLTRFGAYAVRRMNRLGIIVDVAHCSEATVKGVAAVTTKPILCTHANLKEPGHRDGDYPRYLSPDYARMVQDTGGVIGAWIAVLWDEKLPGLIRHLFRLTDAVGIACRHRHRPASRRGQDRTAGFLASPGDRDGVAQAGDDGGRSGESVRWQLVAGVPRGACAMSGNAQGRAMTRDARGRALIETRRGAR
jgi:hypothetical protein